MKNEVPNDGVLQQVERRGLPGLFWTAYAWGAAINVNKADPLMVAQLPVVRALLERCAVIDPSYFHAGSWMALGILEAAIPKALGGQPDKAKEL